MGNDPKDPNPEVNWGDPPSTCGIFSQQWSFTSLKISKVFSGLKNGRIFRDCRMSELGKNWDLRMIHKVGPPNDS